MSRRQSRIPQYTQAHIANNTNIIIIIIYRLKYCGSIRQTVP